MDDYISREAALNFEMEIEADPDEIQAITKGMALYADYIKKVPAANVVKKKTSKWAEIDDGVFQCSECKKAINRVFMPFAFNYCPSCGARKVTDDV